jgi:23S rRNA (cytidine1920-2'-O)/16S rRNA (cytidine1409-2'-O)-methyltransferase
MALDRLDTEVVRRGLARSREHARELITAGHVHVQGVIAQKPATRVDRGAAITVHAPSTQTKYVSRGAHKLIGALDAFSDIPVAGAHALDVGASTGGFTQVLLERGADAVIAVDVGYGQLAWSIRTDPRVTVIERMNARSLQSEDLPYTPDLVVADVSFISLRTLLPALAAVTAPQANMLLMVKPQFEVGREQVGSGVVHDPDLRASAVLGVIAAAHELRWWLHGVVASPLPGPQGNVEYFIWLRQAQPVALDADAMVRRAVQEGPA